MPYEQFKALRKQAGYTQVDVATILGINPTSIPHGGGTVAHRGGGAHSQPREPSRQRWPA